MATREELRAHGLRAYEAGRLKAAARVAFVLVPLTALCLVDERAREVCACVAVLLLGVAVLLRWRNRQGVDSVTTGLVAGSVPLFLGLGLDHFGLRCGFAGEESFCTAFALLVGGGAGVYIATREDHWRRRVRSWATAGAVAALAASLGCIRLGVLGVASVVAGIGLGVAFAAVFARFGGGRVTR